MTSLIQIAKSIARPPRNFVRDKIVQYKLEKHFHNRSQADVTGFDFENLKIDVLKFLKQMKCDDAPFAYHYSSSSTRPTLYSSVYACMTLSLLGELDKLSPEEKSGWGKYFDSFQSKADGLFYDSVVQNEIYNDSDWWGARHLALHIITAYADLGVKPRYEFNFLKEYTPDAICKWLDEFDWDSAELGIGDVDNKIMNIGCLLQYQRDFFGDAEADLSLYSLKKYLKDKIYAPTGMWGGFNHKDPRQRSRMIQFAYHLLPIFFYDDDYGFDCSRICDLAIKTQNKYGGFGVQYNSSACEDIDSIYLIAKLFQCCRPELRKYAVESLNRGFNWVLQNRSHDGGFVFRLFDPLKYGHEQTSSLVNEGGMFPTWFRILSIAHISKCFGSNFFVIKKAPGLEYL